MKESIINFIYVLSKLLILKQGVKAFYMFNSILAANILNKKEHKTIIIKGGYAEGNYEPVVSDIDFIVITNNYKESKLLKFICPLVKDIDVYTEEEFIYRLKYGSLKYSNRDNWIVKKGSLPKVNYLFYPEKIKVDIIEEIYFYYEWLYENAKFKLSSYRKACILRNLKKVRSLLPSVIESGENLARLNSIDLKSMQGMEEYVAYFIELSKYIPYKGSVESNEYIENNFNVTENKPTTFDKIYLNQSMFNLFYLNGCIDTYHIYKSLSQTQNKILNHLQILRYSFKILDGKTNHVHDSLKDIALKEKINLAKDILDNFSVYNFNGLYSGKTVFITASWGNDYLNRLLEAHRLNNNKLGHAVEYLHVSLGGDERLFADVDSVTTIRVENLTSFKGLWHKESLFNLAIDFINQADAYIFSDIDAVVPDAGWLLKLKDKLKNNDAIQPFKTFIDEKTNQETYSSVAALEINQDVFYAPGLMWAFNQDGINKIHKLCDSFHDGSNDGLLFKEITKSDIGMVEKLDWIAKKIVDEVSSTRYKFDYLDYKLSHISHPLPKHYINMILFFNMILPLMESSLQRSDYGLWEWKDGVDPKLKHLFAQFRKDRGFCDIAFLNAIKPYLENILNNKTQRYIFYLDEDKRISLRSEKGDLNLFVGRELQDLLLFFSTINESIETNLIHELEDFKKDTSYSLSFVFESESDLSKMIEADISKLKLMDLKYSFVQSNKNLWYLTINFYAWEEIKAPILHFNINTINNVHVRFQKYQIDNLNLDRDWEWFAEHKKEIKTEDTQHKLKIDKELTPKWYKAVLKLDDHDIDSYKITIKDSNGMNIYLQRIQNRPSDHLEMYFKPTIGVDFITFNIETSNVSNFKTDLVVFH